LRTDLQILIAVSRSAGLPALVLQSQALPSMFRRIWMP
jgi:hypothetical protein